MGTLSDDLRRIKVARGSCGTGDTADGGCQSGLLMRGGASPGRAYEKYDLFWLEEPLAPQFKNALGRLAAALIFQSLQVKTTTFKYAFLDLIQKGGVTLSSRITDGLAAVTEWMEIAAIADAHGIKVASHVVVERQT